MNGIKYDEDKRARAGRAAVLRAVVAAYIGYIAYKVALGENTTMSRRLCYVLGAVFLLAALLVGGYTFYRYRCDIKDAVIKDDEVQEVIDENEIAGEKETADGE
jgi:hypothetical protein